MRALLIIATLLVATPAVADAPAKPKSKSKAPPTHISEADAVRVERARLRAENAELRRILQLKAAQEAEAEAQKALAEFEVVASDVRKTYQMGPQDDVDTRTREIKRAPPSTK
jgi:crotonobetainyl-CoA:carnitine CoA-transferase CaiB-like acyl-CoA transferase